MKYFASLIIAIVVYLGFGLVVWNIVYSNLDVDSMTLEDLTQHQLSTYSTLTLFYTRLVLWIALGWSNRNDEGITLFLFVIVIVNLVVAYIFNGWENAWISVKIFMCIIYNVLNVGLMTFATATLIDKKKRL